MKQREWNDTVDGWLRFYRHKWNGADAVAKAQALLIEAEKSAKSYGVFSDRKAAEICALKILAKRDYCPTDGDHV